MSNPIAKWLRVDVSKAMGLNGGCCAGNKYHGEMVGFGGEAKRAVSRYSNYFPSLTLAVGLEVWWYSPIAEPLRDSHISLLGFAVLKDWVCRSLTHDHQNSQDS
jgi:hypothetical protein